MHRRWRARATFSHHKPLTHIPPSLSLSLSYAPFLLFPSNPNPGFALARPLALPLTHTRSRRRAFHVSPIARPSHPPRAPERRRPPPPTPATHAWRRRRCDRRRVRRWRTTTQRRRPFARNPRRGRRRRPSPSPSPSPRRPRRPRRPSMRARRNRTATRSSTRRR